MMPSSPPDAPLALTVTDLDNLDKARRWAKFMAIAGFIGSGLLGILMALLLLAMMTLPGARAPGAAAGLAYFLVGLGIWLVYSGLLLRYASGVAAHVRGEGAALARGFSGLKVLWIVTVVIYGLSILFSIGMSAARLLGIALTAGAAP
jgi:hypothetical protein